jgi:hypothetical protein
MYPEQDAKNDRKQGVQYWPEFVRKVCLKDADEPGDAAREQKCRQYQRQSQRTQRRASKQIKPCQKIADCSQDVPKGPHFRVTSNQPTSTTEIIVVTRVSPIAIVPRMTSAIPIARNHPQLNCSEAKGPPALAVDSIVLSQGRHVLEPDTLRIAGRQYALSNSRYCQAYSASGIVAVITGPGPIYLVV